MEPACFPVICAAAGALCVKLLELVEIHRIPAQLRPNLREVIYWIPFAILPLVGGFLAYVYIKSGTPLSPMLALNIGVTAPLVFRSLAERLPEKVVDPGDGA